MHLVMYIGTCTPRYLGKDTIVSTFHKYKFLLKILVLKYTVSVGVVNFYKMYNQSEYSSSKTHGHSSLFLIGFLNT